ncbi:ABC transporter ATP-binding protein [Geobacillus sp. C56-T3]|uniref:ABC transporter ATP-binding protein n=1 Tax=Geobacillus sp. (strain C56-T3) TaxID=691437 RepID=UPI0001D5839A|nr:ABC transporter ATP-binding protein [Geobacillus sp. C56-T3]ADI27882.1 ABC transporter related protein [Geobacillus sp. C56-T3]
MKQAIAIDRLRLKFPGSDGLLFRDLSLSIAEGEKVLLLGPSGCGKSTLLQVMAGIIPHSIDVPMKAERLKRPERWGYVFQDPDAQFCMPYADEEIAFALENRSVPRHEMPVRIRALLNQVGLEIAPHTDIHTLSGGMKQRLALASVLALEPDVLFLDEPTALLDEEGTKAVWQTVKQVGRGKTVVIVEHKIDHVLDFVDRIVLFGRDGRIIADGEAKAVFSDYKDVIAAEGIWYPGVWDDYDRTARRRNRHQGEELLRLARFRGFRGREAKIYVPEAAVHAGEWIAVTGKNGAGKSTLLHALMQLIRTDGEYMLLGADIKRQHPLYRHIAFVFQNPEWQFVAHSVREELAYSLRLEGRPEAEIEETITRLLREFDLVEQQDQHPYQLSVGQKRRLSVAASIVAGQRLFLLDEPTFGQDAKNTFALLEMLEAHREQGAVIMMVTHDEQIVRRFATRQWVIEDGALVRDEQLEIREPVLAEGGAGR